MPQPYASQPSNVSVRPSASGTFSASKRGFQRPMGGRRRRPIRGGLGPAKPPQGKPQGPPGMIVEPPRQPAPLNDAGYNTQVNALNRDYNDTELGLGNRETGIREQYGFDQQYKENPYTRSNLLKRMYDQRYAGTTNSMASRGQLYSGATNRARDADFTAYDMGQRELEGEYAQALAGIQAERLAATRTKQAGTDQAYAEMLQRAQEQELDPSLFLAGPGPKKPPKPKGPRVNASKPHRSRPMRPRDRRRRRGKGSVSSNPYTATTNGTF